MTCKTYVDGYWWDYAVSVYLEHQQPILRKILSHHRSLLTVHVRDKIPQKAEFKQFLKLAGPQLTGITWETDDSLSGESDQPKSPKDSLFCYSLNYLNPDLLEQFSTPPEGRSWGYYGGSLYDNAVKKFFSVPFPCLKSVSFTGALDSSTAVEAVEQCPVLEYLEIEGRFYDSVFARLSEVARLRRSTIKKISLKRTTSDSDFLHKALGLKPDVGLSAANYNKACLKKYAVPISRLLCNNRKVWHEQASGVGRGSLSHIDDVFDACFPEAHEAIDALQVTRDFDALRDKLDLPYLSEKIDSILPGLCLDNPNQARSYVKLEDALLARLISENLVKLRDKGVKRLAAQLAKDAMLFRHVTNENVVNLFVENDHVLSTAGVSRELFLSNAVAFKRLASAEAVQLLKTVREHPLDVGDTSSIDCMFGWILAAWVAHHSDVGWEAVVVDMIKLAETEERCLTIARSITGSRSFSAKARKTPSVLAHSLKATSRFPAACNLIIEAVFNASATESLWLYFGTALHFTCDGKKAMLIDRTANGVIGDLVWRKILKPYNIELLVCHAKQAFEYFEVPSFVSKFAAGETSLTFETKRSQKYLREQISKLLAEFESRSHN
jgi:hypothetical protein